MLRPDPFDGVSVPTPTWPAGATVQVPFASHPLFRFCDSFTASRYTFFAPAKEEENVSGIVRSNCETADVGIVAVAAALAADRVHWLLAEVAPVPGVNGPCHVLPESFNKRKLLLETVYST